MSFLDTIRTLHKTVFLNTDHVAEQITYTPSGGSATTIPALVERGEALHQSTYPDGQMVPAMLTVHVSDEDVTNPTVNDTFTIDNQLWLVEGQPFNNGAGMITLQLSRRLVVEKGNSRIER